MKLFMIVGAGWGYSFTVVRAESAEEARRLVNSAERDEVIELSQKGPPAIVWCYEYSPDSPRDA